MSIIPFHIPTISGKENEYISLAIKNKEFSDKGSFYNQADTLLQQITNCTNILLTTSCTAALEMTALILDITPGDEVILPSFTFVSTANAFALRGAKLRFADIELPSLNISVDEIKRLVTPKTKAIVVVHYNGYSNNIPEIADFAKSHNIALIEDAAQGIYGFHNQQHLGTFGDFGCISFHKTKNIHCGEGGALLINNPNYTEKAYQIFEKGTNRYDFFKQKVPFYEWTSLGSSYIMDEIRAAFLVAQLEQIKEISYKRMQYLFHNYEALHTFQFNGINFLPALDYYKNTNAHILWLLSNNRAELQQQMLEYGIATSSHYIPLHTSKFGLQFYETALPNTEKVSQSILRFPVHTPFQLSD